MGRKRLALTGFSLLELLFALAIIASITLLSLRFAFHYRQSANIDVVKSNISMLYDAARAYYQRQCANKHLSALHAMNLRTLQDQTKHLLLTDTDIITADHYNVRFEPTSNNNQHVYRLVISAKLTPHASKAINWYQGQLNASAISTSDEDTLEWWRIPSYSNPKNGSSLWMMKADLRLYKNANEATGEYACSSN